MKTRANIINIIMHTIITIFFMCHKECFRFAFTIVRLLHDKLPVYKLQSIVQII